MLTISEKKYHSGLQIFLASGTIIAGAVVVVENWQKSPINLIAGILFVGYGLYSISIEFYGPLVAVDSCGITLRSLNRALFSTVEWTMIKNIEKGSPGMFSCYTIIMISGERLTIPIFFYSGKKRKMLCSLLDDIQGHD